MSDVHARSSIDTDALHRIERRLGRFWEVEQAMRSVDNQDWEYLLGLLGEGGRDRFWKEVLRDLRKALSK